MSAECNACYEASTSPPWVAQFVTRMRIDRPCERHQPAAEDNATRADRIEAVTRDLVADMEFHTDKEQK